MDPSSMNIESSGYKAMLRYVLRKQIQLLVNQLFEETGDETFVLSADVESGSITPLGSMRSLSFIRKETELMTNFLDYFQIGQNKETEVYSTRSRKRGRRTIVETYETDGAPSPAKLGRPKQLAKPVKPSVQTVTRTINNVGHVNAQDNVQKDVSSVESAYISAGLMETTDVPETLEMNAYTEDEQTDLLNKEEINRESDFQDCVTGNQESKLENTLFVDKECVPTISVVKERDNSALLQLENESVVNSKTVGTNAVGANLIKLENEAVVHTNSEDINADNKDIEDFTVKIEPEDYESGDEPNVLENEELENEHYDHKCEKLENTNDNLESVELESKFHSVGSTGITGTVSKDLPVPSTSGLAHSVKTPSTPKSDKLEGNSPNKQEVDSSVEQESEVTNDGTGEQCNKVLQISNKTSKATIASLKEELTFLVGTVPATETGTRHGNVGESNEDQAKTSCHDCCIELQHLQRKVASLETTVEQLSKKWKNKENLQSERSSSNATISTNTVPSTSKDELSKLIKRARNMSGAVNILLLHLFCHDELMQCSVMGVQNRKGRNKQRLDSVRRTLIEDIIQERYGEAVTSIRSSMRDRLKLYRQRNSSRDMEESDI